MRILICVLLVILVSTAQADEIITRTNGTEIRGEIVGFENGVYFVQIGKFTKKIKESDVKDIRDSELSVSVPVSQPVNNHSAAVTGPHNLLKQIQNTQKSNPGLNKLLKMQEQKGTSDPLNPENISPAMMGQIQQMQGNPMMMQMMNRFKDPGFQKKFMDNILKMRKALNPGSDPSNDPQLQTLQGLFQKLNTMKEKQEQKNN